jgi:hypothetical protein
MTAVDEGFLAVVRANPQLRPRVGNPDEMRSNRMQRTLDALKFRVTDPEGGLPEAVDGAVITALNEEVVASAALANKGGLNVIVTYEAFGAKMHGVVRQEIIFADELNAVGRPPGWLSVPLILTSHAWENAKNERSHQDPALAEVLLGEPSDVSRVLFLADFNTAAAVVQAVYQTRGQIWTLVVPKAAAIPDLFTADEVRALSGPARRTGGPPSRGFRRRRPSLPGHQGCSSLRDPHARRTFDGHPGPAAHGWPDRSPGLRQPGRHAERGGDALRQRPDLGSLPRCGCLARGPGPRRLPDGGRARRARSPPVGPRGLIGELE